MKTTWPQAGQECRLRGSSPGKSTCAPHPSHATRPCAQCERARAMRRPSLVKCPRKKSLFMLMPRSGTADRPRDTSAPCGAVLPTMLLHNSRSVGKLVPVLFVRNRCIRPGTPRCSRTACPKQFRCPPQCTCRRRAGRRCRSGGGPRRELPRVYPLV